MTVTMIVGDRVHWGNRAGTVAGLNDVEAVAGRLVTLTSVTWDDGTRSSLDGRHLAVEARFDVVLRVFGLPVLRRRLTRDGLTDLGLVLTDLPRHRWLWRLTAVNQWGDDVAGLFTIFC